MVFLQHVAQGLLGLLQQALLSSSTKTRQAITLQQHWWQVLQVAVCEGGMWQASGLLPTLGGTGLCPPRPASHRGGRSTLMLVKPFPGGSSSGSTARWWHRRYKSNSGWSWSVAWRSGFQACSYRHTEQIYSPKILVGSLFCTLCAVLKSLTSDVHEDIEEKN